jgi:hypothetical protein
MRVSSFRIFFLLCDLNASRHVTSFLKTLYLEVILAMKNGNK